MSDQQLERLQAKGIRWNTALSVITFIIQFVVLYFLNKLINPEEFGKATWALSAFFIGFAFVNFSFDFVAIRQKEINDSDYAAMFYFSLLSNFLLFLLFFFVIPNLGIKASEFAKYYLKAFSLIFLVNALKVIPTSILQRKMLFARVGLIKLLSKVIGLSFALFFAFKEEYFASLFSLYAGPYIMDAILNVFAIKWKVPKYQGFSFVKENFGLASSYSFHKVLGTLSNQLDAILVGQVYGEQPVAEYNKSKGFQNLPMVFIVGPIGQVLFPTFSKVQDSVKSLSFFLFRSQSLVVFIMIPAFILLFTLAEPFATLYFSSSETKWNIDLITKLLQYFSIAGLFAMFNPVFYAFFRVTSSRKEINQLVVFQRVIFIIFILLTFKYGLILLAAGKVISEVIALIIYIFYAKQYMLKENLNPFVINIAKTLLISIVVSFFAFVFYHHVSLNIPSIPHFLLACLFAGILYLVLSYSLNRKGYQIFQETLIS